MEAVTVTVAVYVGLVPPAPVATSVKVVVVVKVMGKFPVTVLEPLHEASPVLLLATADVALLQFHVASASSPEVTEVGDALKVHVGAGLVTVTVTVFVTETPTLLVATKVKMVVVATVIDAGPFALFEPVQVDRPLLLLAVREVLFEQLHDNDVAVFAATFVGEAVNVQVGAGTTVTVTVFVTETPTLLVATRVKMVVVATLIDAGPIAFFEPVQVDKPLLLLAVRVAELEQFHDNVVAAFADKLVGEAVNVHVGGGTTVTTAV